MPQLSDFDKIVGKIAGAIYSDIVDSFPQPPLMLVPTLTLKVRRRMEQITDLKLFTMDQRIELAKDMQISIVPLLFSLEIDPEIIDKIIPTIERSALHAINQIHG